MTDYKLDMGTLETALQKAFELGGLEDGSYHLEAEEIEQVIRAVVPAVQGEPVGAMSLAYELGGLEDGSYHLEVDELERVIYAARQATQGELAVESSVIAGALFDFIGFLTTRDESTAFGATSLAATAVDLLSQWAETRKLHLDGADVEGWQDRICTTPPTPPAVTQPVEALQSLTAMVDAAMVEMENISPPMRRSECERLIRAALAPYRKAMSTKATRTRLASSQQHRICCGSLPSARRAAKEPRHDNQ